MRNKRSERRIFFQAPISLKSTSFDRSLLGKIVDLSETSVGISAQDQVPLDEIFYLTFNLDSQHQVKIKAKVLRVGTGSDASEAKVGLRFLDKLESVVLNKIHSLRKKPFEHDFTVYLKDTNVYGNVYFSRYFEWQGTAREAWFVGIDGYESVVTSGIKMITKRASIEYEHECLPFEKVRVIVQFRKVRKCSFEIFFTIVNRLTKQQCATGLQTITFADPSGKLTEIPYPLLNAINSCLEG